MKSTVKTAISIDATTFKRVDRLARRLHISRSQFFTQAAQYMLERNENLELLQRINAAYAADTPEEQERRTREKEYTRRKVVEEW